MFQAQKYGCIVVGHRVRILYIQTLFSLDGGEKVHEGTFAKSDGGEKVCEGTFAKSDGGEKVREGTFAKGDGGENVCEGRGGLRCHRMLSLTRRHAFIMVHVRVLDALPRYGPILQRDVRV